MEKEGVFESKEDLIKRQRVLGQLHSIFIDFIKEMADSKGLTGFVQPEKGVYIFTFGSYRIGVHNKGADIDTLFLAPNYVTREDFFQTLGEQILRNHPEVSKMVSATEAHVPIIKLHFMNVPIDLLFAQLSLQEIPQDIDLGDDQILRNLENKTILSMNGCRVANDILRLVPNEKTFRSSLRLIKIWAQRRAIYGNVYGYFGGVNLAILTAFICQKYPNASTSIIISKFFLMYSNWNWGWKNPIKLKETIEYVSGVHYKVWNPQLNIIERRDLMPIITPSFPAINSTHNVSRSTLKILKREFERGNLLMNFLERKFKLKFDNSIDLFNTIDLWDELLRKSDFFIKYNTYLRISVSSIGEESFRIWKGWLESRIRVLLSKIEYVFMIESVHLYPFPVKMEHSEKINIEIEEDVTEVIPSIEEEEEEDIEENIEENSIYKIKKEVEEEEEEEEENVIQEKEEKFEISWFFGIQFRAEVINASFGKQIDLSDIVTDFKKHISEFKKYNPDKMFINVTHMNQNDFPESLRDGLILEDIDAMKEKQKEIEDASIDGSTLIETTTSEIQIKRKNSLNFKRKLRNNRNKGLFGFL